MDFFRVLPVSHRSSVTFSWNYWWSQFCSIF